MGYSSPCGRPPCIHHGLLDCFWVRQLGLEVQEGPCGQAFSFLPVPLAAGEVLLCGTQGWYER